MTELTGGGPHDGLSIDVPRDVVAVVLISERLDGEHVSSLSIRGDDPNLAAIADCLEKLSRGRLRRGARA